MNAEQNRKLYAPLLDRPWVHQNTDYNGNAAIVTDQGMYVCAVPHEVAHRIVEDHNTVAQVAAERDALTADVERLREEWETADSVAQMAAHDRDEALEQFARVEQEIVALAKLIDCAWSAQCGECLNAAHALLESYSE